MCDKVEGGIFRSSPGESFRDFGNATEVLDTAYRLATTTKV